MRRDPITTYGDDLAVVTVVRVGTPRDAVHRMVRSVRSATTRPVRIVLADSSTGQRIEAPAGVEVMRLGEDVGRAAAVNRVVAGLDGGIGWVALADPAVEWSPGALDALLAAARPRAGALGPGVRDPSGTAPSGGAVPTGADVLRGRVGAPPRAGTVGWLPATCLLLRRAALDSVDGFDPRYLGEWDDVDLGDRLGRAGWLSLYVPGAEATVHPAGRPGMLEPRAAARRRFVHDRGSAATRALLALAGRGMR